MRPLGSTKYKKKSDYALALPELDTYGEPFVTVLREPLAQSTRT